jgi:hypothetical protein
MPVFTQAHAYSCRDLHINFVCPCGHWFKLEDGDFSEAEYLTCPDCGRRHLPVVNLVTHRPRRNKSADQSAREGGAE